MEVSINKKNLCLGILVAIFCVYVGVVAAIPHQSETVTAIVNVPSYFSKDINTVSGDSVSVALNSNTAVLYSSQCAIGSLPSMGILILVIIVMFVFISGLGGMCRCGGMS